MRAYGRCFHAPRSEEQRRDPSARRSAGRCAGAELPREAARQQLTDAFGDAAFAEGALITWAGFVDHPEEVTSTVEELTGAPARSFDEWARDHADDLR